MLRNPLPNKDGPACGVTTRSFESIYRAYFSFVYRVVRRAGVPDADVPDVLQEVFVALARTIDRDQVPPVSLHAWLRTTAYRKARDHRQLARNREVPADQGEVDPTDETPTPEERLIVVDLCETVEKTLNALPPHLRLVLVMSDIDEMPMSEIAEVIEIPVGTGFTRLRAARKAFSSAWDEQRAIGASGMVPFAMWNTASLLSAAKHLFAAPESISEAVWQGVRKSVATLAGAGSAATTVAVAAQGAHTLTTVQIACGIALSAAVGAGGFAGLSSLRAMPAREATRNATATLVATSRNATAAVSAARASASTGPAVLTVPPSSGAKLLTAPLTPPSQRAASTSTPETERNAERILIDRARSALARGDVETARVALDRHERSFKQGRFTDERETLRGLLGTYVDGGSR